MPRPSSTQPTEVEMQILRILWDLGPSPVRDIHKQLEAAKGTSYSTTVKMLAVMLQKGLVKRDEKAQPHIYRPVLTRTKAGKQMLDDLIEKVYDGSAMSLVLQALSSNKVSKEELDEVRQMLDKMEASNMFAPFTSSIWADTLGWMLIHSLWQFTIVALLVFVFQWLLRRASSLVRYRISLAAMGMMVAIPIATCLSFHSENSSTPIAKASPVEQTERNISPQTLSNIPMATTVQDEGFAPSSSIVLQEEKTPAVPSSYVTSFSWQDQVRPWLPTIVLIWGLGVLVAALRPILGWHTIRRLRTTGVSPVENSIRKMLEQTAKRLKLRQTVEVLQSSLVKTPMVVGYFRPIILLPLSVVTGLPESQLELILAHELAHVRRHDYLMNLLQTLVETLFFYHPAMWWLSRQIRNERENCCDDIVVTSLGSRLEYGRALLAVVELREATATLSLAAHGGSLVERIKRLAGCEQGPRLISGGSFLCVLLVLTVIFAAGTWAADSKADPSILTAEAFFKLSNEEQRMVLVKAFQKHLEQGKNLSYETDQVTQTFDIKDGKLQKPRRVMLYCRLHYRYWRLGDSYKTEKKFYRFPMEVDPFRYETYTRNAKEGISRVFSIDKDSDGKKKPNGQVCFLRKKDPNGSFHCFPSPADQLENAGSQSPFFQYLIESKDKFEIQAPIIGNKVQLTVPWSDGQQVFLLDPQKGFLPVSMNSKMEMPATKNRKRIAYEVKFEVQECRQIDNVWMPVKMTESVSSEQRFSTTETKVFRIESGNVKPADLLVPFPEGTQVQDIIEGITYTVGPDGKAINIKDAPEWKHDPPEGWEKAEVDKAYSLTSVLSEVDHEELKAYRKAEKAYQKIKLKSFYEGLAILKADPPVSQEQRIEAAITMLLQDYDIFDHVDDWAFAVRELITIGKPAVPRLIEELDKTNSNLGLRGLGFVLRGINDPRAIPALIRVIPRLIQPHRSDCGVTVRDNPELQEFMWKHDSTHTQKEKSNQKWNGEKHFSYGRPIREIMPALEKSTGQSFHWMQINITSIKVEDITQQRAQCIIFLNHARQWADWWSKNWQDFVENEEDAQLEQIQKSLDQFAQTIAEMPQYPIPTEIPCGSTVKRDGRIHYSSFEPYLNLDVSSETPMPEELFKKSPKDKPSAELLDWARREGIDLLRVEIKRPGDEEAYYGYYPIDMKVWKIDNKFAGRLEYELQKRTKLDLPLWKGPLLGDKTTEGEENNTTITDEEPTTAFLFITKQGACGMIKVCNNAPQALGVRGVGPSVFYIYESEP